MHGKQKAILSWSGGKDSAFALHEVLASDTYEIVSLLTTLTDEYQRTCMHGVRRLLLEQQAEALGLPLDMLFISKTGTAVDYEAQMGTLLETAHRQGVEAVIFGDIFLEDLRAYREEKLSGAGLTAVFPLWGKNTAEMSRAFIDSGFRAVITCVDSHFLDASYAGQDYDELFLNRLPQQRVKQW